jgi:hypothetical protein
MMSEKKLWNLIITNDDTGHDDTWPSFELVMATAEEIETLTKDIEAEGSSVYVASEVENVPSVEEWRKENEWLFGEPDA